MRLSRFLVITTLAVTIASLSSVSSMMNLATGADLETPAPARAATAEEPAEAPAVEGGAATTETNPVAGEDPAAAQLARGKYLAHDVAMCVYCHSPRNAQGKPIESRFFSGSTLPVGTPLGGPEWSSRAPNLRSIVKIWGEKDFAKFLQSGHVPHGGSPKLPMPQFRMNEEDSAAIAKYLSSFKS